MERITDDDRLAEIGRILAQGALRIVSRKNQSIESASCRKEILRLIVGVEKSLFGKSP